MDEAGPPPMKKAAAVSGRRLNSRKRPPAYCAWAPIEAASTFTPGPMVEDREIRFT